MFASTYSIVLYLMLSSLVTPLRSTQHENFTLSLPMDWDTLCPYTDFCTYEASQTINFTQIQKPCCEPCSCDAECGLKRNCCLYSIDKYRLDEKYHTTCTLLSTVEGMFGLSQSRKRYMTVDKCPNMTSCYNFKAAPWGSMYPVVSENTSMIYLNEQCAACHGENNITKWKAEVNCHLQQEPKFFHMDGLANALLGNPVEPTPCYLAFLPPDQADVSFQSCFHERNIYRKCLYEDSKNDDLKALCEAFNATYVGQWKAFSNIFCYLCSTIDRPTVDDVCDVDDVGRTETPPFSSLLHVDELLAFGLSDEDTDTGETQHNTSIECQPREIKERKTGKCRKLRCVAGQTAVANKCLYLGEDWTVGPFLAYIKLEPFDTEDKFPVEQIGKLRSYKGKVFKSKLKSWSRGLFHYTLRNDSFVKYFVLMVYHKIVNIDPVKFLDEFKWSLETTWSFQIDDSTYQMKASLHKFNDYFHCNDNKNKLDAYYGSPCKPLYCVECDEIVAIRLANKKMQFPFISLTEFFFCDQVDLTTEEYIDYGKIIYFNVTGRYLENAEIRRIPLIHGNDTVSVCLNRFGDDFWLYQNSKSFALKLIFDTEFMTILSFISCMCGVIQSSLVFI